MISRRIARRKALKLILASTGAAALSPALHARARYPTLWAAEPSEDTDLWIWMGRAIYSVTFREEPARSAQRLDAGRPDQSFSITREVHAPFSAHNDLWYETSLGYVHSAFVHPVRVYPPQPFIDEVSEWGFWGEVSQPFTEAYKAPNLNAEKVYRFYGGTVYHVVESFEDGAGTGWYKVFDELPPVEYHWVLARDVRRIPRAEMAPIRPFAGQKRIEVDLDRQRLICYEGTRIVFTTPVASGLGERYSSTYGATVDLGTPTGEHSVLLKQASRHMSNEPRKPGDPPPPLDAFDLPGIPWNTFFDLSGTAIHGTYWHNDFGIKRSHGCVNVSISAARWVFRWVYPIGGYEDDFIRSDRRVGTPIHIFESE